MFILFWKKEIIVDGEQYDRNFSYIQASKDMVVVLENVHMVLEVTCKFHLQDM